MNGDMTVMLSARGERARVEHSSPLPTPAHRRGEHGPPRALNVTHCRKVAELYRRQLDGELDFDNFQRLLTAEVLGNRQQREEQE